MNFNQLKLFYFSGTGNARHVAYWVNTVAVNKNLESEIIDISKLKSRREIIVE